MAWSENDLAGACARELADNEVVYLGAGLPRLLRDHLGGRAIIAVDGGGIVGLGPAPRGRERGLRPAEGGELVTAVPGGAIVGPVRAAAMLRRGWIDVGVVEAGQVDAAGTLALRDDEISPGHVREIARGAARLIAVLPHLLPDGSPALRRRLAPGDGVPGKAKVALAVTELGVFQPDGDGFRLLASAPEVDLAELQDRTGATVVDGRAARSADRHREPPEEEDEDLLASAAAPPD